MLKCTWTWVCVTFYIWVGRGREGDCRFCIQKEVAAGTDTWRKLQDVTCSCGTEGVWKLMLCKAVRFSVSSLNACMKQPCVRQPQSLDTPASRKKYTFTALPYEERSRQFASVISIWIIVAFFLFLRQLIIYSYTNNGHCSPQANGLQPMYKRLSTSCTHSLPHIFYKGLKLLKIPVHSPMSNF